MNQDLSLERVFIIQSKESLNPVDERLMLDDVWGEPVKSDGVLSFKHQSF